MALNIVTGRMLKGLRGVSCRITTICKCKGGYIIREYDSTLNVGLARAVSPTNTNFRLTFLLTRLKQALYEDLAVYSIKFEVYHHFSGL